MQNEKICMASAWSYRGGSQAERFSIARIISLQGNKQGISPNQALRCDAGLQVNDQIQ